MWKAVCGVLAVIFIIILAFDLTGLVMYGIEGTISHAMRQWSYIWPPLALVVAFGFGLLTGHLFW